MSVRKLLPQESTGGHFRTVITEGEVSMRKGFQWEAGALLAFKGSSQAMHLSVCTTWPWPDRRMAASLSKAIFVLRGREGFCLFCFLSFLFPFPFRGTVITKDF